MIVIADTTPLNYLILTDLIHIVSALFGQVIIPVDSFETLTLEEVHGAIAYYLGHRTEREALG